MTGDPTCPRCFAALDAESSCSVCELEFVRVGNLLDVLGSSGREKRAAEVEGFYTANPFPGYAPADDGGSLLDRSRRSAFLTHLDAAIPVAARVLDCGCGTAQLAAFLALAAPRRRIFGVDGCLESLTHAERFRARSGIDNLQLVRADLFDLPTPADSFDVVICRGVVHHTPDPDAAIRSVAECVAPGGVLVLGFYESMARLFHRSRRMVGRLIGRPIRILDPVLWRRDVDPEKKRIWIEDQYHHPLEHVLSLPHVVRVLLELDFEWLRTVPPLGPGTELFDPTVRPSRLALGARRVGWMFRGVRDPDAGLVCYVARRRRAGGQDGS